MTIITIIGFIAGFFTTISLLPQVLKIARMKETKEISGFTYELLWTGIGLWLIYGVFTADIPLIVANAISLTLASLMLFFKFRYG